jgi:hypothetical protein
MNDRSPGAAYPGGTTDQTDSLPAAPSAVECTSVHSEVDVLANALAYARAGFPVLPVHSPVGVPGAPPCPCRRQDCGHPCSCLRRDCAHPGKHPRTRNGFKDATTDPDVITRWCSTWPGTNIGLVPGLDVVAVDVDRQHGGASALAALVAEHGHLTPTFTAWTGGGGLHALYRAPGPFNGTLCRGVDLKGNGMGYIVAAPSLHKSGHRYHWANELPIAVAPQWLAERMLAKPPVLRSVHAGMVAGGPADDGLVRTVAQAPEGERNHLVFWAACRAMERGGSPELLDRIAAAAVAVGLTEHEVDRTIGSATKRTGVTG